MTKTDKYFEKTYILYYLPFMVGLLFLCLTFVIPFLSAYFTLIVTMMLFTQLLWWWFDIVFSLLKGRTGNFGWLRARNVTYRNQKYEKESFWIVMTGKIGLTLVLTVFYTAMYMVVTNPG